MNKKISDPYIDAFDDAIEYVKNNHPTIDIAKMRDLDRMLNWELWHGPLPSNYWTEVEPCNTPWRGFEQASNELEDLLSPLPDKVWWDKDCGYVTDADPNEDDENWDAEFGWIGSDSWWELTLRKVLLHIETWKQVF